jgi:hypothetical protein
VKISVREAWREIKYWIADNLFEYELDEAYRLGMKEGAAYATQWLSFRVEINLDRVKMTKTEKSGYQKAIEVMRDERKEIKLRTGASVDVNRFMD